MAARLGESRPADDTDLITRTMAALALAALAVIHVVDLPGTLGPTPLVGIGYFAIIAVALLAGGAMMVRSHWLIWTVAGGLAVLAMGGYALTRSLSGGFLGDHGDVGNWNCPLGITRSSATDIYPNTATLSFRAVHYTSAKLTLRTTELTDNVGQPLQAQTPLDAQLIGTYDVPPYVNSVDQSGAVPFLDIGNRYVLAGAQYNPQVLAGLSAAQIASQLSNPASPVAQAIDGSASVIVAAINQALAARS